MKKKSGPQLSARKKPQQARSANLVNVILEAAVRVLARDGAQRFNTPRVAEEAGVSVGSLYQYFPNKVAILFRLQANEWEETWGALEQILSDAGAPPLSRLHRAIVASFRSERAEADVRVALDDAGTLFRDTPEARALQAKATRRMRAFMSEALPSAAPQARAFAADYVLTSMFAIAEKVTEQGRSPSEVEAWAETSADLLCGFLEGLERESGRPERRTRRVREGAS